MLFQSTADQNDTLALETAHMRSVHSFWSFHNVDYITVRLFNWQWPHLVVSVGSLTAFFPLFSFFSIVCVSPTGDQWCDAIDLVLERSVSSSSTLHIFRGAGHLWCQSISSCAVIYLDPSKSVLLYCSLETKRFFYSCNSWSLYKLEFLHCEAHEIEPFHWFYKTNEQIHNYLAFPTRVGRE